MKEGPAGPLDYAENENQRRTGSHHYMDKISSKINGNAQVLERIEREQEMLHQQAMNKQAAATASTINGMYGRSQSTGFGNGGFGTSGNQARVPQERPNPTNTFSQGFDHKKAVNELYNKRDNSNFNSLYNDNAQKY